MPQFGVRQYRTVPDVLIGVGALNSLQVSQDSKVLIITGNKSYAHELESKISGILSKYTNDILIINKAKGEPNKENINQALKKIRSNQFDKTNIIIAAGGGSVLDSATLLRTKIQFNEELETWSRPFSLPKASQSIPIISIPTTHGSGAEVSSAVAWSPDAQGKQILLSHEFLSHQVILDGSLSTGLPRQESCNTALDALTHAIEGFFSTLDHPIAHPLAIPAMKSILKGLPKVLIDPNNSQYRQELLEASYNAGIVQNHCSVGLVHSISHQLSRFGFGHGYLNGKFLVPVLTKSFDALNHKSNQLARQMGYTDRFDLLEELEDLIKLCQLPNLASSDILFEDNKSTLISDIKSDITFRTHPVKVSDTEIDEILTKVVN